MKKLGFLLMSVAVLAFTLNSCKPKPNEVDPVVNPGGDDDELKIPAVEATDGAVTLVIYFDQAPCDGYEIRFVGAHAENSWDPNTAPAMKAIGDGWYQYVAKPAEDGEIHGRPIQCSADDAQWSHDWSHDPNDIEDLKGVNAGMKATNEYGETNLNFTAQDAADGAVVVFRCKKWNVSPCAAKAKYNLTVTLPAFCDGEFAVEVVGSFEGWGTTPVALVKGADGKYTATIEAMDGDQWKVRGEGGWDKEIQGYVADPESEAFDTWIGVANNVLGAETTVAMDYSDPAKYRWNVCAE